MAQIEDHRIITINIVPSSSSHDADKLDEKNWHTGFGLFEANCRRAGTREGPIPGTSRVRSSVSRFEYSVSSSGLPLVANSYLLLRRLVTGLHQGCNTNAARGMGRNVCTAISVEPNNESHRIKAISRKPRKSLSCKNLCARAVWQWSLARYCR